jgi:hypothetical protein
MFSRIRKRFTFANVVVVFALVFAMTGGAYAASKYVITSTKQISPQVLKQLQGKGGPKGEAGAGGAAGSIGTQGPIGPAGPNGKNGEAGAAGVNGEPGQNGKSVLSSSFAGTEEPSGKPCHENGGTKLEREDSGVAEYVCDGKEGKNGKEGEPWTAGGTLPSGKTETGGWAMGEGSVGANMETAISFTIPLGAAIESSTNAIREPAGYSGSPGEACPGSAASPQAAPGDLCVYVGAEKDIQSFFGNPVISVDKLTAEENGADAAGARIVASTLEPERSSAYARGTWAVTAP